MWTEREKYIVDVDEIDRYIESMDNFHDYRIGSLDYKGETARITVEEEMSNQRIAKSAGLIWNFIFEEVERFVIDTDCVLRFYITEVAFENGEFVLGCTNGYIVVKANKVKLGIPCESR